MIELGRYQKNIAVIPELLIENERDWEHLPHVHSNMFSGISLIREGKQGWDCDVIFIDGSKAELNVIIDENQLGWTQDTIIEGQKIGRTITKLEALNETNTSITVTFYAPDTDDLDKEGSLAFYQALYSGLLNEDEKKVLGRAESIKDGGAGRRLFRTVLLEDGSEHQMPLACPHKGLPLDCEPNDEGIATCPWHGYQFDIRNGKCTSGQIRGWRIPNKP